MTIRSRALMSEHVRNQVGTNTVVLTTGRVRPKLEMSRINGKIPHQLHASCLSQNTMPHNTLSITASCLPGEQSLPPP